MEIEIGMLVIFLNWIYILFTAFLCGFAFAAVIRRAFGYQLKNMVELIFYGLMIVTVYAQLFSMLGAVGALANILLIMFCMLVFIRYKKEITYDIYNRLQMSTALQRVMTVILAVLWCYCTSRGYMHYDSDLYHAQSIRWIEEYGIVPGLGNIHVRFAYNSSFFSLSALYSMRYITGQSLHTLNGFFALLLSIEVLDMFVRRRRVMLSDFARIGALYYLTLIYRDIVAPASDYCVMCMVFYLIIRWLSRLEQKETDSTPYALLCVLGVYCVTLKLTAGIILLLVIKPAYMLLKDKQYGRIAIYILLGILVLVPWIMRTAIISGYLIYPFPALDVLDADWKMDKAAAALDAAEIKTWGRGLNNASLVDLPVHEWLESWFRTTLPALGKILIIADAVCLLLLAGILMWKAFMHIKKKKTAGFSADNLLVLVTVAVSYMFWQLSAPLLRYGYAYILLLIVLTVGILLQTALYGRERVFLFGVILLVSVKAVSFTSYIADTVRKPYYVCQQDYGSYDMESFEADGIKMYYPKNGDRVGYECFPAVPRPVEVYLRSEELKNGFMIKKQ